MYKILSLDGGGIGGLYTASLLSTLEQMGNVKIADYFDLIVGTSTGGIIALGLGAGLTATEIKEFYYRHGPRIFPQTFWSNRIFKSKYSSKELENSLYSIFGEKLIGHSTKRLAIPTWNLDTGKARVYKTAHHQRLKLDYKKTMVEVALATSAAMTYLPAYSHKGAAFVDGGIWANNPIALAVTEALSLLDWRPGSFKVLSIGCPSNAETYRWGAKYPLGITYWANKITPLLMQSSSEYSLNLSKLLSHHTDDNKVIYRIQQLTQASKFKLDKATEQHLNKLIQLGEECAKDHEQEISSDFFHVKAQEFKPIYTI